jgi:DNA-binding CsgD family transcriptional regulator
LHKANLQVQLILVNFTPLGEVFRGDDVLQIQSTNQTIGDIAANGFAIGYGNFACGDITAQSSYPEEWQGLYLENNWLFDDPVVRTGLTTPGLSSWSRQDFDDPAFRDAASDFNLTTGTVISHEVDGHRCILGIAHTGQLTEAAEDAAQNALRELHHTHLRNRALQLSTTQRELVYLFANGHKAKRVAAHFGVSEDAIKQRKQIIQRVVGVNSFISAVSICATAGLTIHPIS